MSGEPVNMKAGDRMRTGTYEGVDPEDPLAHVCEADLGNADLPAVVRHTRRAQCTRDDLVSKAYAYIVLSYWPRSKAKNARGRTDELHTRLLRCHRRDERDELVDPLEVVVRRRSCQIPISFSN